MKMSRMAGSIWAENWRRVLAVTLGCALETSVETGARTLWEPTQGPLKTRWAKEVNPNRPLRDYPRPQLARNDWLNLNGLWDMGIGAKGADAPLTFTNRILVPFPIESALSGVRGKLSEN